MKAAVYRQYGPPEVVSVQDLPKPTPGSRDVLIRVHASTVNRTDAGFRSAEYFISRFWSGLLRPKFPILGCEFAGVVEAIGSEVTLHHVGERVFGFNDKHFGGHAEYMVIAEADALATIPDGMSYEKAAALTEGSHYALVDIKAAGVKAGQHVMVYGASGAIGSAAVQLLKSMDVHVTAVCGTKHVDLVKNLGADVVVDYQKDDYTTQQDTYDFILDSVGKSSFGICKPLLNSHGIYISTEFGKNGENIWYALTTSWTKGKRLLFPLPTMSKDVAVYLRDLAIAGKFDPVIDRTYPLEEIVDAYRYVETGQKVGNVIIQI